MMAGLCSVERVADVLRGRRLEMTDPEDALLDALHDEIGDALAAGDFAGVDAKITKVDVAATSITTLLGWLSITSAAAEHLPARAGLAIATIRRLCREEGEDRARELLRGLAPMRASPLASEHPNPLRRAMTTAEWLKNH